MDLPPPENLTHGFQWAPRSVSSTRATKRHLATCSEPRTPCYVPARTVPNCRRPRLCFVETRGTRARGSCKAEHCLCLQRGD
eukprot:871397-Rhodomonas_salina.1